MHGCITDAEDHHLVVTDEDYINFISNARSDSDIKRLPWHVEALLGSSTVLFVGYSLEDWNFRVFFKATGEKNDRKKYAIQYLPPLPTESSIERAKRKAIINFWDRKGVDILNVKADIFMKDLLETMKTRG